MNYISISVVARGREEIRKAHLSTKGSFVYNRIAHMIQREVSINKWLELGEGVDRLWDRGVARRLVCLSLFVDIERQSRLNISIC
jgi:hypothetical protein